MSLLKSNTPDIFREFLSSIPELSTSPASTYRSSEKWMPPVFSHLRWRRLPTKKDRFRKSFGLMSDAFSTVSLSGFGKADWLFTAGDPASRNVKRTATPKRTNCFL